MQKNLKVENWKNFIFEIWKNKIWNLKNKNHKKAHSGSKTQKCAKKDNLTPGFLNFKMRAKFL